MKGKQRSARHPLFFASPWILAAAIGILCFIVIFFTINNLQREKRLITESLFNKGMSVIRFVGAGTRASMMMGAPSSVQVQHLVEQASGESNILYIAVVEENGRILAHSNRNLVDTTIDHPLMEVGEMPPRGRYQILERPTPPHKVFEVASVFRPFQGRGPFFRRHSPTGMRPFGPTSPKDANGQETAPGDWCQQQLRNSALPDPDLATETTRFILVGLDMTDEEKIIRQDMYHILFMSLAILLVGIGSWIALLSLQGFKASQKTLQYMQAFTGLLISRLPVGIVAVDHNGAIKTFNDVAAELTGVPTDKALGQTPGNALPQNLASFFTNAEGTAEIHDRELEYHAPDHKTLTLHVSSVPIYDQTSLPIGRVLLLHDLSQLKTMEREMQKHERLVSLGKMAAGVAHEVRNPLSSIKGLATLLGSRFAAGSEDQQSASLLIKEVERLNRSITELLNFARPLPLKREPLEMATLIGNSLQLIDSDAQALKVRTVGQIAPELPTILADGDRLTQVFLNLYLNSLQAMEGGGTLTVTAGLDTEEGRVRIEVRDTGCGIAPEIIDRIMDPYFTTKPQGTGLGLALVHKIIDEHQGTVQVTSQPGEGTTVTITLPVE